MEANKLLEIFFSLENPAIYAIIFMTIVLLLVFLIKNEFIKPLSKKKKELELENAKLSALYAEVDPDPVIRLDNSYIVIDLNNAAREIFNNVEILKKSIFEIIPKLASIIHEKLDDAIIELIDKYYAVTIKRIEELKYVHVYLHDITDRVVYEQKIENYQNNLKELRSKIENVNEEEKQRIGKELHDSVGHSISLLKLEIQNLMDDKTGENGGSLRDLLKNIDDLSCEVRELSHQLRPRILAEFGLFQAVKSLVDKSNIQKKIHGYVTKNEDFIILDKKIEQNIYRICQEALNNIIKHSDCSELIIDFKSMDGKLSITISDDGVGFDLEEEYGSKRASLGLLNMKERAESCGGSFTIDSIKEMGTTIFMSFNI